VADGIALYASEVALDAIEIKARLPQNRTMKQREGIVMPIKEQEQDGQVKRILAKGDLSANEVKNDLWDKDVSFVKSYDRRCIGLFWPLVVLWLLPAISQWSGWRFLNLFRRLPRFDFPIVVIVIGAIFLIAAISLEVKASSIRKKRGGCKDVHETVFIIREGPYRLIRHTGYLAELVYFPLLPIVLSRWIPFTVLAVVYMLVWTGAIVYLIKAEDSFNLRKWGDEYQQYMNEVPAINFVKGLRKTRKGAS
jgi:protein-S-isoprenylcysteine O-methyltransferase Ste14